jgi:hypothetical protein
VKRPQPGEGAVPKQRSTDHFELKPAQQRVLGVLKSEGATRFTRARYEALSGVGRSQAAYDLAELVEHGILERLGSGRATRYRIVHVSTTPGRSGRRRWTQERIRAGLMAFCAGRVAFRGRVQGSGPLRSLRRRQPLRRDPLLDVGARAHARAATGATGGDAAAQDVPATAAMGSRRCGRDAGTCTRRRRAHPALARERGRRGRAAAAAHREPEAADGPAARATRAGCAAREAGRSPGPHEACAARDVDRAGLGAVDRVELGRAGADHDTCEHELNGTASADIVEPGAAPPAFRR